MNLFDKSNIKEMYPLTPMQAGILYHMLHDVSKDVYIQQISFRVDGPLNTENVNKAFNKVIERHDVFRTVFVHEKVKNPMQVVLRQRTAEVAVQHVAANEDDRSCLERCRSMDRLQGFDLSKDLPARITVIQNGEASFHVIWSFHHIIIDGWCLGTIMKEFFTIYGGLERGVDAALPQPAQFKEYVKYVENIDRQLSFNYWEERLDGFDGAVSLPRLKQENADGKYDAQKHTFTLGRELSANLRQQAKGAGLTLFALLQTAWGLLLQKYNNANDVVFGTVIAGRPAEIRGVENIVGLFINTIPARIASIPEETFMHLAERVQRDWVQSQEHGYISLSDIHNYTTYKSQLIDHILVFENYPMEAALQDVTGLYDIGLEIGDVEHVSHTNYDLNVVILPEDDIHISFEYNAIVHSSEFMEDAAALYRHVLNHFALDLKQAVDSLPLSSSEVWEMHGECAEIPNKSVVQLFEEQAELTPDRIAIIDGDDRVSFAAANGRTNRLARELLAQGFGSGQVAAVIMNRSSDLIVSLLAVAKTGGAYLAIDPDLPQERVRYMLDNSEARFVLTNDDAKAFVPAIEGLVLLNTDAPLTLRPDNIDRTYELEELAYIIYTSGSTGMPKGVMIPHRGLSNYLCWAKRQYVNEPGNADFPFFTSVAFDMSITSIFVPLISGGTVIVYKESNPNAALQRIIQDNAVSHIKLTPSHLSLLDSINISNSKLTTVIVGGENLSSSLSAKIQSKFGYEIAIYNEYGPTETVVGSMIERFQHETGRASVAIGKPIDHTNVCILNERQMPVPRGAVGELYIGGLGVALGYINQESLTKEKFISLEQFPGSRWYRSGDLVRMLPNGTIECLGRIDSQVKINGVRIELEEVQAAMLQLRDITDCVVTGITSDNGELRLAAYYVADKEMRGHWLREQLMSLIPRYMVPALFIRMERIPLSASGKVDLKSLPAPLQSQGKELISPRTDTEKRLAVIWEELIGGGGPIGIQEDFFEAGGQSLKAMMLAARLNKDFGAEITVRDIYTLATIERLAQAIDGKAADEYETIPSVCSDNGIYPATLSQSLLMTANQKLEHGTFYNQPGMIVLKGQIEEETLINAILGVLDNYDVFRTSFRFVDGAVHQIVHSDLVHKIERYEVAEDQLNDFVLDLIKPFDLYTAPLVRVALIKMTERDYALFLDTHHIISDGISQGLLFEQFAEAIRNKRAAVRPDLQYKDYAVWREQLLAGEAGAKQKEYWLNVFSEERKELILPYDRKSQMDTSSGAGSGRHVQFGLGQTVTQEVALLSEKLRTTSMVTLLAAYKILLAKYTGHDDVAVGLAVSGRKHPDVQKMPGLFVNSLPIRSRPGNDSGRGRYITEVGQTLLEAYEHQDYPLEELLITVDEQALRLKTMFVMDIDLPSKRSIGHIDMELIPLQNDVVKFELVMHCRETESGVSVSISYNDGLFDGRTIERMAKHYLTVLEAIISDPELTIGEIRLDEGELTEDRAEEVSYPVGQTIHRLFEEQAERTPERIAVSDSNISLTYKELNKQANRLARRLKGHGVVQDGLVAIMIDRSVDMVVGILAILKAGGAYVPIDAAYPAERIQYLLNDCQAGVLVTDRPIPAEIGYGGTVVRIDEAVASNDSGEDDNLNLIGSSSNLAYVIYTSGTTGRPKGVMIEHRNVVRLFFTDRPLFEFGEDDVWAVFHSFSFDFSVWELFGALLHGGKAVIVPSHASKDPELLLRLTEREGVTVLNQVPTAFYNFMETDRRQEGHLDKLRYVIFGGEALQPAQLRGWKEKYPSVRLINMFGITETTVHVTYKEVGPEDIANNSSSIGTALPTLSVYVMDGGLNVVPIGAVGELCVAGEGLARCYLGQPELTDEKFIEHRRLGKRLYRSGDKARRLADGTIEYLGRIDQQINIKGFRIEPGEIEAQLMEHGSVRKAVVVEKGNRSEPKYLCAYYVADSRVSAREMREHACQGLPVHMLPSYFVQIEAFPLTPNGKLDKASLPDPALSYETGMDYVAPRSALEYDVANMFADTLRIHSANVGAEGHFFHLGGDSIQALKLVSKINSSYLAKVSIRDIYQLPTVSELARHIGQLAQMPISAEVTQSVRDELASLLNEIRNTSHLSALLPPLWEDVFPMSDIQKGMVYHTLHNPEEHFYHEQFVYQANVPSFQYDTLLKAFELLAQKHPILRTNFNMNDYSVPLQIVHKRMEMDAKCFSLKDMSEDEQKAFIEHLLAEDRLTPFNLLAGGELPLWRVRVFMLSDDTFCLCWIFHHAILDGWSNASLMTELSNLYTALKSDPGIVPSALSHTYKDFVIDQLTISKNQEIIDYWKDELNDYKRFVFPDMRA